MGLERVLADSIVLVTCCPPYYVRRKPYLLVTTPAAPGARRTPEADLHGADGVVRAAMIPQPVHSWNDEATQAKYFESCGRNIAGLCQG